MVLDDLKAAELVLYNSVGKLIQRWNFDGISIQESLILNDLLQVAHVLKLIIEDGFATKSLVKL